ncbi:MAG: hypothetical protein ACM3TR_02500 [Caulobacteraceae bacterium]
MAKAPRQMMYYNGYSAYVLDYEQGDINGDGITDYVYLTGDKPYGMENAFADNIAITILDGSDNKYSRISLNKDSGYNPSVFLGDFTGDNIDDILVNIDSGGSGGFLYSYIYSFLNNMPEKLFDFEEFNGKYLNDVLYKDFYKVDVISGILGDSYTLCIENKGKEYLSGIYGESGLLKEPLKGEVAALSGLYPVDYERDGIYELNAVQRIIGRHSADTLGFLETVLGWDGGSFVPKRQHAAIPGKK